MISIFGDNDSSESNATKKIIGLLKDNFKSLDKSDDCIIKAFSGAKFHGYKAKDIDSIIICEFNTPQTFSPVRGIKTKPDDAIEKKEITIESLVLCIEVKDHDPSKIKFEGDSVMVKYGRNITEGWHSASDQNMKQAHTLKDFFNTEFGVSPYVTHLLYLTNLEESELPKRPHNIITPHISPRDFLTVITENTSPFKRKNGRSVMSCSAPQNKDKFINSSLFKELTPSSLDRKKVDAISSREGFDEKWLSEIGKRLVIFRGRAGTGKTIALLQSANVLFEKKGSRVLFLTYNKALVSDIARISTLLGLPSSLDDGGVSVQSCMAFFYKILTDFALIPEDEEFLDIYERLLLELNDALANNIFSQNDINEIFRQSPEEFAYDYIFIDEGQDWKKNEIQIIKKLFHTKNIAVADGMDQLIRGSRAEWTNGLKESERIIFSLRVSLRMKSNLTNFINQFAKKEEIPEWKLHEHKKIRGGSLAIVVGDFWEVLPKLQSFIDDARRNKNKPVDLMMLITYQIKQELESLKSLDKFEAKIGCKVWEGYLNSERENYEINVDSLRIFQYQSARGLEGWTTFLMNFDEFYENQINLLRENYHNLDTVNQSIDEWLISEINRWLMMVLTRSVDTTLIHFKNEKSEIFQKISFYSKKYPDYISLI
ncbi:hypothetical protein N9489_05525 [Methylophilaceae bacterium]|nr:hypothetical protein [Methylophilaceae bacterium]